ncbi:spindle and centriole-associated protein 1 isoform X4 [Accipiter gentilis]|uniref:spindle and centriole-associated protein 1 isoform X4 n=1 Tax=Astur gentilis TaxID=8957 RepID=UPI00211034F7|nr:spindle and centriole-associated protein 1 isoform X4 [Accipiter gentilis]XP_049680635.1 spindle and centriole-associated protein 1 isoform X4 [Accipiter gentilis]XP_049680636.1 spindle and centriole-associated protein 1 isoform X4 [Accipiter gentilis]XP_049680637.1 spindle and centriole-associated protein 1 isoform X4 [Accipiter gentilis]
MPGCSEQCDRWHKASILQTKSTVHDLSVHRATPEDILRRHEMHKSKNKALAHLELQEKALKRKWKKQKQLAGDSLEKRKLTLMREILSDQYHLQDVLERSDQVMAVAKDLFGDAPRTRTGFPNVTMAPNCDLESSQGPIVQKCDPSTQLSILSESVMDSQVLNEVEEEALSIYQSEDGRQDFLNFKSSINSDRLLRLLREENSLVNSQLWAEKDMRKTTLSQESNMPLTPTTVSPSLDQSALNATNVVKRIHSRLQNKDEEEAVDSTYTVRQVLNPNLRKQKQIAAKSSVLLKITYVPLTRVLNIIRKMKRKQTAQNSARQSRDDSPADSIPTDLRRDNKSSLDILNHMIREVEHELEEYERCTGREVQKTERSEGLTGFTLSLVNALCRLMRYLKESEMQLREKEVMRQQHEEVLNEHRELIDALTAEILLVREENTTIQKKLQQYMMVTDEQLISLTQAFKGLPLVEPRREQSPNNFGIASKGPVNGQEEPDSSYFEPSADACKREGMLKFPQEELPLKFPLRPGASGGGGAGRSLPAHIFQPAVLLSPPRQKSSQELSPLQNVFTAISQSPENTEREPCKERSSPSSLQTQSTTEENCLISRRQPVPPADKDLENSHGKISLSCSGDARKNSTAKELFQNSDLLGQIAELTRQNSLIKAQLSKLRGFSEDTSDCLHQPDPIQNANRSPDSSQGQTHLMVSKSLEERIAELNRQSTEARDKLLQLIDQQKLAAADVVPPTISPVLSPSLNYTENARRTIDVSIPMAVAMDSSKEDSVSPASVTSIRRSVGDSGKSCSPLSASSESVKLIPVSQRPKVEKQKEEGWFALSMHIM